MDNGDNGVKGMKRDMLESLDKRYANAMQDTTYVCSTILDPRFKTMLFPDSEAAIDILRSRCLEVKENADFRGNWEKES